MKIGCCASIDKAPLLYQAGYDFIECPVVALQPEVKESECKRLFKAYEDSPLPVDVCNILLPPNLKIVGDDVDEKHIQQYISSALERVHRIGAGTVVFGSGKSRSIQEGFSRERGEEQVLAFLEWTASCAEPLGITVVVEPLNRKESNLINSIPEAVSLMKKVNRPSINVLADFYHMQEEQEPLSHIGENNSDIRHLHVADTNRFAPGTGNYPYDQFVRQCRKVKSDVRLSIECQWHDFETEVVEALQFLRKKFDHKGE
ncbi:sugar phosphate isomerase/epimerase [Bacillaceae bacterium SIJ1]|uniref:sugar phosphate isomerase/epimerase family protein n=1 Tax=Litoribacterium kuwaitense TaxID=1398745 RepID=UPI0013EB0810|nr:sugar phosphate isomerase/epimerase family protein [Litoribacterium kuwaitense]NGP46540.1 sugar phosphate isomerase/epimerase [Litoribacterium kuwaitense]